MRTDVTVRREVLPSGLTVLVETLPYVRSVALGYYLRSGSAIERSEHAGASHFLEHLVFKGTESRSTADIAGVIDILGGDVDAFTGKEYTSFYAHVLDEQVDVALDLLTDIVLRPNFSAADIESERSVILEEIRMVEDTPDDLVHEIFVGEFWQDHPLGRPILGTEETVRALTGDRIREHYAETFHPENLIFCRSFRSSKRRSRRALRSRSTASGRRPSRASISFSAGSASSNRSTSASEPKGTLSSATSATRRLCSTRSSAAGCRRASSRRSGRARGSSTTFSPITTAI
jgi:hypothetical protein